MITATRTCQILLVLVLLLGGVAAFASFATAQSIPGTITVTAYLCPPGMTPEDLDPDACTVTIEGVNFAITSNLGVAPVLTLADASISEDSFVWTVDASPADAPLPVGNFRFRQTVMPDGYTSYEVYGDAIITTNTIGGELGYLLRVAGEAPDVALTVYNFSTESQGEQGDTPTVEPTTPVESVSGRPAHIHGGTCNRLAKSPRYDLFDLTRPEGRNTASASVVIAESSVTVVNVPFDEFFISDYAIDVRAGRGDNDGPLVCGEIGGPVRDGGSIIMGLREDDNSGFAGIAQLIRAPGDPSQTQVTVFIAETGS